MLEKQIERKLVREVKNLGGVAYKFISPGNSGVPDRIVILPGENPIFVELKTDVGKLTDLQKRQLYKLNELGQEVRVLYGEKDVNLFIENCKEMINGV